MRAVILAGGKGTRLAPYTVVFPKPLVPLGDMPILELLVRRLKHLGIVDLTLSVGHLAELIVAYFGDGSRFGVDITYVREETPLGTAGPLALVPDLDDTFLVMNGDLLTTLDCRDLVAFHRASGAAITLAACERTVSIDLGVLDIDPDGRVREYLEKPVHRHWVSMGIYVFEPSALRCVTAGERLDLPDLVRRHFTLGQKVSAYRYGGYWLDIGRQDDYARAVEEFPRLRAELLPDEAAGPATLPR